MHVKIVKNYHRILETRESLNIASIERKVGRRLKMTDLQVVELSLTAEYMSIDGENLLLQLIPLDSIENLLKRSQFNKRRRKLLEFTEQLRKGLSHNFIEFENYFKIDSMPLEICK